MNTMTTIADIRPYEPTSAEIQSALSENLIQSLPSAAVSLGGLYLALTLAHFALLEAQFQAVLVPVAALSSLLFFITYALLRSGQFPALAAHGLAGLFGLIALVNSLLHVAITGDPLQSSNILLVIVAVGAFFLSPLWYWLTIGTAFFAWLFTAISYGFSEVWLHFAIGMVMAVVAATLVNRIRTRTYTSLYRLRLQQENHSQNLEEAHAQLEQRVAARTVELASANKTLQEEVARRRKTENALKDSERTLLHQRENLQKLVASQTEELQKANATLKESANLKADVMDEIRYDIQPQILELKSKMRLLEIGLQRSLDQRQKTMFGETIELADNLLNSLNSIKAVTRMSSEELKSRQAIRA